MDPLFVYGVYHKADSVGDDEFLFFGQVIQMFNDVTAYGVIVLGSEGKLQGVI